MDKVIEELMKERLPIHPKCKGEGFDPEQSKHLVSKQCSRIENVEAFEGEEVIENGIEVCRCTTYVNPSIWWRNGKSCPMADHYQIQKKATEEKVRAGQQKQKKRK